MPGMRREKAAGSGSAMGRESGVPLVLSREPSPPRQKDHPEQRCRLVGDVSGVELVQRVAAMPVETRLPATTVEVRKC